MQSEVKNYRALLEDIHRELRGPSANRVAKALEKHNHEKTTDPGNGFSSSSLAFNEELDIADEDSDRHEKSRAAGSMGSDTGIARMQRLNVQPSKQDQKSTSAFQPLIGIPRAPLNGNYDYLSHTNMILTDTLQQKRQENDKLLRMLHLEETYHQAAQQRMEELKQEVNRSKNIAVQMQNWEYSSAACEKHIPMFQQSFEDITQPMLG
ncbi:fungal-specific transcription factor domain-containing protein [Penicillium sp. IBT 35674x]|nr:fungal-specific transcription factor domain-containing protein [Penicillium sp. IBT 35674x]